jgi:general secretion pathway protein J
VRLRARGFTLIELLVAVAIFAVISSIVYGTLSNILLLDQGARKKLQSLADLQRVMILIERDLLQLAPRTILNEFGDQASAFQLTESPSLVLEFTRGGYQNPGQLLRSSLKRVAYSIKDEALIRTTWAVLDRASQTQPEHEEVLLEGVKAMAISAWNKKWQNNWPSRQENQPVDAQLPGAVKIEMQLQQFGEFEMVVPTPGSQ